jgi:DNA-binding XRE family transcriptional regulator
VTTLAELGHQLRAMRAASGRTVASVAADAGLSVPYIANLENGRGNPTMGAVDRLAAALGSELTVSLTGATGPAPSAPQSLVRFARTGRVRHDNTQLAATLGVPPVSSASASSQRSQGSRTPSASSLAKRDGTG